ncbi:DNA replication regulator SLD3-domain-containing protein [Chaetomium fimeti]|uniref:DNA replication regulator SLD3-domain-containing protein n=1 Tax=Chaetomium fimeti TaxID=1854472 RepID=A0AAE0HQY9_9PEZI|nr:DNA replication regulator SLD3-domain-containing protein [Chaetomium fimeti]
MSSTIGQSANMSRPGSRLDNRFDSRFETRPSSRPSSRASVRPSSVAGIHTSAYDAEFNRTRPQSRQSLPGPGPASPSSGKRKRTHPAPTADDGLLKGSIVLKPHPSSLSAKPRILHPLMLLPREALPLSALDLSQPHGDFPASRLFESKIKILDLEGRLGSNVLLARSETTRRAYAVERENNGLYVLCKLGSWVDIEMLSQSATVVCKERMRSRKAVKQEQAAETPLITPSMYSDSKRRRLAIEEIQSLVRKRSISVIEKEPPKPLPTPTATEESPASSGAGDIQVANLVMGHDEPTIVPGPSVSSRPDTPAPATEPVIDDPLVQPDAEDIFLNIRAQYMEALYHSKGSLAYFAKGPLSKARAAFHLDWDSNLNMNDLVEFLKSLIMTTVVIDKKYRETIPEIVAKMKTVTQESENGASKPRKKKAKKPKLGKDGLYPGEINHVRRWWTSHQPDSSGDDANALSPTEHKYHVSCLRRRETQLQIILVLEILALEPVALAKGAECQLPGMESQVASREESQEPSAKKRNRHNLPVLLEVHADRLCIWQSTTLDEVKAVAESQIPAEGHEGEQPERANSDPLRDFCVDIIVPFFSARLPGHCDSLNRKLGGPVAQSPVRAKVPSSAVKPKPGAPMKRPTAKRDKDRTLERALSVERSRRSVSRGPAATIALLRSATQTVIPGLKREATDSSLMGMVPRAESGLVKERPSHMFSRSVSLGGVDLKAQKKAQVDAELKDAISALKKPNRTLAAKDIVEAAEKRTSAGQLKRMRKPTRPAGVQVKATPANNRFKDALAASKTQSQLSPFLDAAPSSASVVPASTLPRKFANRLTAPALPADRIQTTPVRPTHPSVPATGLRPVQETPGPGILPSSPIMARKAAPAPPPKFALAQPRSKHLPVPAGRSGVGEVPSSPGLGTLFETPVMPRSARGGLEVVDDTPIKSRLPLGLAGDGGNRVGGSRTGEVGKGFGDSGGSDGAAADAAGAKENGDGGGATGSVASIYQRLGWDTTDLDDIDDLL